MSVRIPPDKVGQRGGKGSRSGWLKTDFVVDRVSQPLFAAEISLRRLNADVTDQELNLLKLPTCLMRQAGRGATQIVRGNAT